MNGQIDWTFLLINPSGNEIIYEGYKESRISYKGTQWSYVIKDFGDNRLLANITLNDPNLAYPFGRRQWIATIEECGNRQEYISLTIRNEVLTCSR